MGSIHGLYKHLRREDTECVEPPEPDEEPDEGGGVVEGGTFLVPEGEYELRYVDYETADYFGGPKVVVHFAIIEPEEYAGLPIDRFYNVKSLDGPPRIRFPRSLNLDTLLDMQAEATVFHSSGLRVYESSLRLRRFDVTIDANL